MRIQQLGHDREVVVQLLPKRGRAVPIEITVTRWNGSRTVTAHAVLSLAPELALELADAIASASVENSKSEAA